MDDVKKRYTVHRAYLPNVDGMQECYLILDDGLPATDINKALIVKDKEYSRPPSTDRYHLCIFLNYLDDAGVEYLDATMEQIHQFLVHIYSFENVSYGTLKKYIDVTQSKTIMMNMRYPMDQHSGLRHYQEQRKDETRTRIDEAIQSMRAEGSTINISSLAEETGLCRRTFYADYVQSFLKNYREFNPAISEEQHTERITELKNNLEACKGALKKREKSIRELKLENCVLKQRLHEADEQYKHLLGKYQVDVGSKIIHF